MNLFFTYAAKADLIRLREFIAVKNPAAAQRISQELKSSIRQLLDHPEMGVKVNPADELRDLISGNYISRYWVSGDKIYILRIWHAKESR